MAQEKPRIIELNKIGDRRGNLSIVEEFKQIPFEIKRTFWIYDVPGGAQRGGHAYRECEEFIVALSGSFTCVVDAGDGPKEYHLNRSYYGLYVPKGCWRVMQDFSTNSVALVLASTDYNEDDYIWDYEEFRQWKKQNIDTVPEEKHTTTFISNAMKKASVFDCSLYELTKNEYPEGNLTYIYNNVHVPFKVKRVFYSYDIPGGESRGAHAHKNCHQLLIAASGAYEVVLDDGTNKRTVTLNRPFWGLHVPPGVWAAEQGFSSGAICLVLASEGYDEEDYIREYEDYTEFVNQQKK
ncbi:MAG: FdtA/QdtA family cupin domain-containing protein [Bacteroidaceae bacterium]|nr:FdtA/QdtA family cupin domain-containing protein [Bacteroidaceae bacterium]